MHFVPPVQQSSFIEAATSKYQTAPVSLNHTQQLSQFHLTQQQQQQQPIESQVTQSTIVLPKIYLKPGSLEYIAFIRYLDSNSRSGNARNICCTCWILSQRHLLIKHKAMGHRILTPRYFKDESAFASLALQYGRIKVN